MEPTTEASNKDDIANDSLSVQETSEFTSAFTYVTSVILWQFCNVGKGKYSFPILYLRQQGLGH